MANDKYSLYTPQKWSDYNFSLTEAQNRANGALPTAERFNHIEQGIYNGLAQLNEQKQDKSNLSHDEELWTGGLIMGSVNTVKPSKKIKECETGWRLQWMRYNYKTQDRDSSYPVYTEIRKDFGGTLAFIVPHAGKIDEYSIKHLSVANDRIVGHELNDHCSNKESDYRMILTAVYSY